MNKKREKKPWPTKDAMRQIYEKKLWGADNSAFYSGEGSHKLEIVVPYITAVSSFLASFKHKLVVCDLGCGDFNIGKQLVTKTKKYIAVDIVCDLIAYNREQFLANNLTFQCLNIATDPLPVADCAIIRQVLQHLSNAEVQNIVHKLKQFKYLIITEHIPQGNFKPNKDIISGQGIRLKKQSGINVLLPPFNLKVKKEEQLGSIFLNDNKGVIKTMLYYIDND